MKRSLLCAAAMLLALAVAFGPMAFLRAHSQVFALAAAPVDPVHLFLGRYVWLEYPAIAALDIPKEAAIGSDMFVVFEAEKASKQGAPPSMIPTEITLQKPPEGTLFFRTRVGQDWQRVDAPNKPDSEEDWEEHWEQDWERVPTADMSNLTRYFLDERLAPRVEDMMAGPQAEMFGVETMAEIAVHQSGAAFLVGLRLGGVGVADFFAALDNRPPEQVTLPRVQWRQVDNANEARFFEELLVNAADLNAISPQLLADLAKASEGSSLSPLFLEIIAQKSNREARVVAVHTDLPDEAASRMLLRVYPAGGGQFELFPTNMPWKSGDQQGCTGELFAATLEISPLREALVHQLISESGEICPLQDAKS